MIHDLDYLLEHVVACLNGPSEDASFGYGNQDALMKWLENKNKSSINKFLNIPNSKKYPLIWLVEGWEGVNVVSGIEYRNITFHFSVNSNIPALNEDRKPQFEMLFNVANKFIEQLKFSGIKVLPNLEFTKRANFLVSQNENTIDVWDTVVLRTNLLLNTNCIKRIINGACGAN